MEIFKILLHLDSYLGNLINFLGPFSYVFLFLIIFAETGLVIAPFLPGDSLLFVIGTLSGSGYLNIWVAYFSLLAAAILGDTANYWIGNRLGAKMFSKENSRFFNKSYIERTQEFYEKHGGKTIILARFVPIIRTFAPFVAGVGKMHYRTFLFYNFIGAFAWITILTFAGYFFGGLTIVKKNFEYAVIGVVIVSLMPMAFEYIRHKKNQMKQPTVKNIRDTFKEDHLN